MQKNGRISFQNGEVQSIFLPEALGVVQIYHKLCIFMYKNKTHKLVRKQ